MAVPGYNATIKVGTTLVKDIMTYELPFKTDMIETTAFSTTTPGTKTFIPGLYGAQIKCSGNWNKTDTGQSALETAYFARTMVNMIFSPDGVKTYTLSGWISDYSMKADPKSAVSADFTFQMDGGVTIA